MTDLAFSLHNVSKTFSHFTLSNLSIELAKGEIMGLIGANGAGKSTTLKILMGMITPDSGNVNVLGHLMPQGQVLAKADIGYVSEDLRLYKNADLAWHMNYVQQIFPSWDANYAAHLVKHFDLNTNQNIKGFSHGQRVKASLLLALARKPKLLLLDEPTTGLDPVARHEILSELMAVLADEDRSILFSSHNTQDIEQLSDHITFIDRGRLIDCQDKETYLERWRRIRVEAQEKLDFTVIPQLMVLQRTSQTAVLSTNQFNDSITKQLTAMGAVVKSVERMNLEEIFIAEVKNCRMKEVV